MKRKRTAVIIMTALAVVVAATVGVKLLTSRAAGGVMPNHITVAAAKADVSGKAVRVGGDVVPGSVTWNSAAGLLGFLLTGEGDQLQVLYPGTAPNDFKPGSKIVVEGRYRDGVLRADTLTTTNSPLCKACHQ